VPTKATQPVVMNVKTPSFQPGGGAKSMTAPVSAVVMNSNSQIFLPGQGSIPGSQNAAPAYKPSQEVFTLTKDNADSKVT